MRNIIALPAMLLLVGAQEPPQEPAVLLAVKSPMAQKYVVQIETTLELKSVSEGSEKKESASRHVLKEEFEHALTGDRTRIVCKDRTEENNRTGPVKSAEVGRAFLVSGTGDGRIVAGEDGNPVDSRFASHLGRWEGWAALVPSKECRRGERWEVSMDGLDSLLNVGIPVSTAKIRCELGDVSDNMATIVFFVSETVEGKKVEKDREDEIKSSLRLEGVMNLDLREKRIVMAAVTGSLDVATQIYKIERDSSRQTSIRTCLGSVKVTSDSLVSSVQFSYP